MKPTAEQIRKAMGCKTADELLALAKTEGVELTSEQAEEFIRLMGARELTEDELAKVAGGNYQQDLYDAAANGCSAACEPFGCSAACEPFVNR